MTYQATLKEFSRTPVTLVVITLDYCGRTFGVAPCLATGEPCYNTYPTCKYKSAYLKQTKDYEITSADTPLPFSEGERPYIESVRYMPTEIKDSLTVSARVPIRVYDEPDTDVGLDPYVAQRASVQGTYWKKLLARNTNYRGRDVKIYEGFLGLPRSEFQQRFAGKLDSIKLGRGMAEIEAVDLLKSLTDIQAPPKLDIKLVTDIDAAVASITLTTVTGLDSPAGYVRVGDEIIQYTNVLAPSNQITGCTRGYFGTTAEAHSAKDKVQKVRYYAPANPFDILKEMLTVDAALPPAYVDSTVFDYWRDWPGGEVDFSAIVSEPTKLSELYFELVELLDCKTWVGEDLKITIRRNVPNEPGRAYHELTDAADIEEDPEGTDLNPESRISRVSVYWDADPIGKVDEAGSYSRLDLAVDPDAESADYYGEEAPKEIKCRWLRTGYIQEELMQSYIEDFTGRMVWRGRDPMPIVTFRTELKNSDIKTGDYVRLSTDEVLNIDGTPLDREIFQIIKRDFKGDGVTLTALRITPRKIGFIAPDAAPDWADATDADKEYGYICDDDGLMPDGSPGYHIF